MIFMKQNNPPGRAGGAYQFFGGLKADERLRLDGQWPASAAETISKRVMVNRPSPVTLPDHGSPQGSVAADHRDVDGGSRNP
jgi:hypothetical protein